MQKIESREMQVPAYSEIYSGFLFMPIIGLTGSGKTDILCQFEKNGEQTVSIESLLGICGICLNNLTNDVRVSQEEFDGLLQSKFRSLDRSKAVYIEWKPVDLFGIKLPVELIDNIRRTGCFVLRRTRRERLERLCEQYAEWESNLDAIVNGLASKISPEDLDVLWSHVNSTDTNRFTQFVSCIVDRYFDPEYLDEICKFNAVFIGDFGDDAKAFNGTYIAPAAPSIIRERVIPYVI